MDYSQFDCSSPHGDHSSFGIHRAWKQTSWLYNPKSRTGWRSWVLNGESTGWDMLCSLHRCHPAHVVKSERSSSIRIIILYLLASMVHLESQNQSFVEVVIDVWGTVNQSSQVQGRRLVVIMLNRMQLQMLREKESVLRIVGWLSQYLPAWPVPN